MKRWILYAGLGLSLGAGCKNGGSSGSAPPSPKRMEVVALTGNLVKFVPGPGQLPYCLIYTRGEKGITRQITMTHGAQSVACPAGQPVLGLTYKIPVPEGHVKVYTFFSDQRLTAPHLSEQIVDLEDEANPTISAMNLRLPGRVILDVQDFTPKEDAEALGTLVSKDGGVSADGGK